MTPQERAAALLRQEFPEILRDDGEPWVGDVLLIAGLIQQTRRAALLEVRQAVLGERLSATEIYSSEDEVYNDAIDDALGAIDRLAQEGS